MSSGFRDMGRSARDMGSDFRGLSNFGDVPRRIGKDAEDGSAGLRSMARDVAALGASAAAVGKIGEAFGMLNKEQADTLVTWGSLIALSGSVVRGMAAIASSSWLVTAAEKARAAAHAVANALSGPAGWALLAGAAAAAVAGIALISNVPTRHTGGDIDKSGTYNLLAGETVLDRTEAQAFRQRSLSAFMTPSSQITVQVNGAANYREAYDGAFEGTLKALEIDDSLRRKGASF